MQQYLPLAVLKQLITVTIYHEIFCVATVLTACGIETAYGISSSDTHEPLVATVLTACGIET